MSDSIEKKTFDFLAWLTGIFALAYLLGYCVAWFHGDVTWLGWIEGIKWPLGLMFAYWLGRSKGNAE